MVGMLNEKKKLKKKKEFKSSFLQILYLRVCPITGIAAEYCRRGPRPVW